MRLLYLVFILLFTSCGVGFQYTTLNHAGHIDGIYRSSDYKVDTINSVSDLRWKLRNDFNFRYDFATYAMNQPYSWYWNNPRLENIWRPYNRFDVYFYSSYFWNDWAFNYPFHHTWGWNNWYNWNRPYYYYGWNRPYRPWNSWYQGPWNNPGYNVVWNSSRRGNVAYVNGYRTSNRTSTRTVSNNRRVNVNQDNVDRIANEIRRRVNNTNNNIRVNKPRINNSKPRINNPRPTINNNSRPRINNNPRPSTPIRTTPRTSTRSSNSTTVRSNSRRKN